MTAREIGYTRVSTDEQDPQMQIDALVRADIPERLIYIEHVSGASRRRPQLDAAIKSCRRGDTLVVWRLDRFARSMPDLIKRLEGMSARGVGFRSLTEGFEIGTSTGRLVLHIMGSIAEFERQLISERTKAGLAAARKRGRGAPLKMTEERIAEARKLHKDGMTYRAIAQHFAERDDLSLTAQAVHKALTDTSH